MTTLDIGKRYKNELGTSYEGQMENHANHSFTLINDVMEYLKMNELEFNNKTINEYYEKFQEEPPKKFYKQLLIQEGFEEKEIDTSIKFLLVCKPQFNKLDIVHHILHPDLMNPFNDEEDPVFEPVKKEKSMFGKFKKAASTVGKKTMKYSAKAGKGIAKYSAKTSRFLSTKWRKLTEKELEETVTKVQNSDENEKAIRTLISMGFQRSDAENASVKCKGLKNQLDFLYTSEDTLSEIVCCIGL